MSTLRECTRAFADVLRSPNLRRAQLSSAAVWSSEFAFITALGVYAFKEGGAGAVGLVGFARLLPAALALPFAGALADRMRRERLLVTAGLVRAGAIGLAAAAAGLQAPGAIVYVLAVVATTAFTIYRPAHSALLPALCSTAADLTSANVVRSMLDAASALVAPLIAGGLLAVTSVAAAFAATGLASLYSALTIARLSYEALPLEARGRRHFLTEALEGIRYLPGSGHAALLIALAAAQAFVRGALTVFVVVVALDLLRTGDGGVGVLWAAFGAGGLVGASWGSLLLGSRRMAAFFGLGIVLWGLPVAAIAVAPGELATIGLLALVGAGNALVDVTVFTLLQRLVPDRILARTLGVAEMLWTLAMAAGSLATPVVIWALGVHGALVAVGALLPGLVLLTWSRLRRVDAEVEIRDDEIALLRRVPLLRPLPFPRWNVSPRAHSASKRPRERSCSRRARRGTAST